MAPVNSRRANGTARIDSAAGRLLPFTGEAVESALNHCKRAVNDSCSVHDLVG